MTTGFNYQSLPQQGAKTLRQISEVVNNILKGKLNNVGSVTLANGAATTTLSDTRIGGNSRLAFTARTANAAAIAASVYYDTPGKMTVVIHHTNTANTDQTFDFSILG